MAEIKNKVVTVKSLSTLHEHDKNFYISKNNPIGEGVMRFDGDAIFSGNVSVNSFVIGSNIKLVYEDNFFKIVFLDKESETNGIKLLSSEGFILKDLSGSYLTTKED